MKYRRKPQIIEALKFTGENTAELDEFTNYNINKEYTAARDYRSNTWLKFNPGDYIVKGIHGEIHPVAPAEFHATHEVIEN